MPGPDLRRLWGVLAVVTLLTVLILGLFPAIDLGASALFFHPGSRVGAGFWIDALPASGVFRYALWYASLALVMVALVGLALAGVRQAPALGMPARVWAFILALYLLAPGVIVNLWLKAYWGRARPANVVEFGGPQDFTPFWQMADQCQSNCSFVSGEGAAAMALGISLYVLIRAAGSGLSPALRRAGLMLALAIPVLGGAQRLITGRHFLSDTIMAMAIVAAVALVLQSVILRPARPR